MTQSKKMITMILNVKIKIKKHKIFEFLLKIVFKPAVRFRISTPPGDATGSTACSIRMRTLRDARI